MKKILYTFSLIVFSFFTFSQSDSETVTVEIPTGNFNLALAASEEEDSSKMFGGALELNITNPENPSPIAGLLGIAYESQDWGDFSSNRWNFYLGLNAFFNAGDNLGFVGVKRTFYFGDGTTEEALDCLYCSDTEEDYSGGNFFASAGIYFENNWMAKLDFRISDNFSEWNENSYDPYGVGYSGSSSFEGIPDPKIQISVGYSF